MLVSEGRNAFPGYFKGVLTVETQTGDGGKVTIRLSAVQRYNFDDWGGKIVAEGAVLWNAAPDQVFEDMLPADPTKDFDMSFTRADGLLLSVKKIVPAVS